MSLRKWAIFLGGLFLFGGIGLFLYKEYFQSVEYVKSLIQNEVQGTILEDTLPIQNGTDSLAAAEIRVEELRLGVSFYEFIKSRFKPAQGITEIGLTNAILIIEPLTTPEVTSKKEALSEKRDRIIQSFENTYRDILAQFDNIPRISVTKGSVMYNSETGSPVVLVRDINGRLLAENRENAFLFLSARIMDSEKENLQIDVKIDLEHFAFVAELGLQDFDLLQLPEEMIDGLSISGGHISSGIQIIKDAAAQGKYDYFVNGNYTIHDLAYRIRFNEKPFTFLNGQVSGTVTHNKITIDTFTQEYAGSRIAATGVIDEPFQPVLDMRMDLNGMSLTSLQADSLFNFSKSLQGIVNGDLQITGPLNKLLVSGTVNSDSVKVDGKVLSGCCASVSIDYPYVKIENISGNIDDILFNATVLSNVQHEDSLSIQGSLSGNLAVVQHYLNLPQHNDYYGSAAFNLYGPPENFTGEGQLQVTSTNEKGELSFQGDLFYQNNELHINGHSESEIPDSIFQFTARLTDNFSRFNVEIVNAMPVLWHDFNLPVNRFFGSRALLNLNIDGNAEKTYLSSYALSGNGDTLIVLNGNYIRTAESDAYLESILTFPIPGDNELEVFAEISKAGKHYLLNNVESPDLFSGSGLFIDSSNIIMNGSLELHTDIEKLNDLFGINLLEGGDVSGRVEVSGFISEPYVKGIINLREGFKNGFNGISADAQFESYDWLTYDMEELVIAYNDTLLAEGTAEFDAKNKRAHLAVVGENQNIMHYIELFSVDTELINGTFSFNLLYKISPDRADMSGEIKIPAGSIERFPIRDLNLTFHTNFADSSMAVLNTIEHNAYLPAGFQVEDFSFSTVSGYNIAGSGFASVSDDVDSDFHITMQGDILSLLCDANAFFRNSTSSSNTDIHFTGSLQNPFVESATVSIQGGSLQLSNIAEEIENISLEAELQSGSRFFELKQLSADIDGRPILLNGYPNATFYSGEDPDIFEPITLMDDGLNLGILTVNTGEDGIDIYIPDVIEKNETVTLQFGGRNANEQFYIAGPVEHPVARGVLSISDGRIIYPDPNQEPSDAKQDIARRVLKAVNWDVIVFPESNNYYVRNVPSTDMLPEIAYIIDILPELTGEARMEFKIEDEADGLHFSGSVDEEDDHEFNITGDLISTRGTIQLLNEIFRVVMFEAEFSENSAYPYPVLRGSAKTTRRGTNNNPTGIQLNSPVEIYITLVSEDENGGLIYEGTWVEGESNFRFELSTGQVVSDLSLSGAGNFRGTDTEKTDLYYSTAKILELLGYSQDNIGQKVSEIVANRLEQEFLDPIIQPVNQKVRKTFGLDEFRFQTNIARSFSNQPIDPNRQFSPRFYNENSKLSDLLFAPEVNLAKYLAGNLYFMYRGQMVSAVDRSQDKVGLNHLVGLEYQMRDRLFIELQYDYDHYRYFDKGGAKFLVRHDIQLKGIKKDFN
ncbi:hypothetical protein ACFL6L_03005 [candidate division KSB1 bacterium]